MTLSTSGLRSNKKIAAALLAACFIITQSGCGNNAPPAEVSRGEDYLLNTYCTLTLYEANREGLIREAFAYARSLENILSRTVEGSEVSAFNRSPAGEAVFVSDITAEVVERGLYYSALSGGLFDITLGALTELWNFSSPQPAVPSSADIEKALGTVGYQRMALAQNASGGAVLTKEDAGLRMDLGGIAKGFIADKVKEFLEAKGVREALINFGGNVVVLGEKSDGTPWMIGVEKPFSAEEDKAEGVRDLSGQIAISGGSVVTSGVYERKFVQDGKLYHHILDPKTGYPRESDLISATIIGPSSTDCDALSTLCLLLGREAGLELIEGLEFYEGVFIGRDGEISLTSGARFTPN